jgi:hypothetical protein
MSMKNSNDTIGNRSRDLPVCSAVPQPLRHQQRAPVVKYLIYLKTTTVIVDEAIPLFIMKPAIVF